MQVAMVLTAMGCGPIALIERFCQRVLSLTPLALWPSGTIMMTSVTDRFCRFLAEIVSQVVHHRYICPPPLRLAGICSLGFGANQKLEVRLAAQRVNEERVLRPWE
jgi:hypothetical protein